MFLTTFRRHRRLSPGSKGIVKSLELSRVFRNFQHFSSSISSVTAIINRVRVSLPTITGDLYMKKLALILSIGIVFASFALAQGSTQQPKVLTLDKAITIALDQNISIRQAVNNTAAAQGGVLAAYGSYLPTASASASWTRTATDQQASTKLISGVPIQTTANSSTSNWYQSGLSLGYTIFNGFARESGFSQAVSAATSVRATFQS